MRELKTCRPGQYLSVCMVCVLLPCLPEEGSIHCRLGQYGKSQLCVVVLLRTENTCQLGRYGKESCCPPCYPWAESSRETERGGSCRPIATEVALLAVPARPALNRSGLLSLSHTQHSVLQRQADGTVYAGVIGSKWRSSVL